MEKMRKDIAVVHTPKKDTAVDAVLTRKPKKDQVAAVREVVLHRARSKEKMSERL